MQAGFGKAIGPHPRHWEVLAKLVAAFGRAIADQNILFEKTIFPLRETLGKIHCTF